MKKTAVFITFAAMLIVLTVKKANAQCAPANFTQLSERDMLLIDARPDQINSFKGKTEFKREASVALVNMNPFIYSYRIKVKQQEIQDIGFLHFLKLLGSPVSDIATASPLELTALKSEAAAAATNTSGSFKVLKDRTAEVKTDPPATCEAGAQAYAKAALNHLADMRKNILERLSLVKEYLAAQSALYSGASAIYEVEKENIYSETIDETNLCLSANRLRTGLMTYTYPSADHIEKAKEDIANLHARIDELEISATEYKNDEMYKNCQARSKGLSYATSLISLAQEMRRLVNAYGKQAEALGKETETYDFLKKAVTKLNGKENELLRRTFTIKGQFDISAANIKVFLDPAELVTSSAQAIGANSLTNRISPTRTQEVTLNNSGIPVVGSIQNEDQPIRANTQAARSVASAQGSVRLFNASARSMGNTPHVITPLGTSETGGAEEKPEKESKQIEVNTTIGARRFELSGGMVFASLPRREFKSVLGYARNQDGVIVDENGNPTDKRELTPIVGLTQNSKRRFAPIVLLHTRLTSNSKYNLFFSLGVSGKKDDSGFDLEYLIGPSVNFLNKNMFFTFGGYAGRQQRLAGDLFVNSKLPSGTSEIPTRKGYEWKPGFSFTYRFPFKGPTNPDK